jgi:signal peptidase I
MGQDERRGAADRDSERETRAREIWGPPSTAADQPTAALPVPPAVPLAAAPTTAGRRARGGSGRVVRELVETLLLALVIFLAVRLFVANFRVEGESMAQSLDNGQMLLVNANAYHVDLNRILNILPGEDTSDANLLWTFGPPERGDIVVFNPPETPKSRTSSASSVWPGTGSPSTTAACSSTAKRLPSRTSPPTCRPAAPPATTKPATSSCRTTRST